MKLFACCAALALVAAIGCSESVDDDDDGTGTDTGTASGTSTDSGTGTGTDTSGGTGTGTSGTGTGTGTGAGSLVINELNGKGDDWIEIYNGTSDTMDIGGLAIADTADAGGPNTAEAVRFPAGTMIAPGEHIVIILDQDGLPVGPHTDCIVAGVTSCFYGEWKISASNGEEIFLLDANDGVLTSLAYPADPAVPDDGSTWGRLPDGTGEPTVTAPTPGTTNTAP